MNIVDKSNAINATAAGDLDRFRLRRFIEGLPADELEVRSGATDLADVAQALEGNPRAVLFEAAGPERQQLVGSVTGSRSRIARAFGVAPNELLHEIQRRMRNKPEIVEVSRAEAPAQQVVLTGADADLTALPVHLQHGADGAPYISVVDRFRGRSEHRLHQCRHPPPDAARPHRGRRRPEFAK